MELNYHLQCLKEAVNHPIRLSGWMYAIKVIGDDYHSDHKYLSSEEISVLVGQSS